MQNNRPQSTFATTSSLIIISSFILSLATVVAFLIRHPGAMSFQFNPYAVLSFLPLAVNVWIILLIKRLRSRSEESVWFVLYLCALSVACLGEGFQRLSIQPEAAVYWFQLNGIGYALLPMAYYLFVYSYVRPLRLQSPLLIASMMIGGAFMLFAFQATDVLFSLDPATFLQTPWGYIMPSQPTLLIFIIWLEMLLITAVVTLFRFRRRSANDIEKQQARVYIWAVLIPLGGGSITDAVLPLLGYNQILPMSLFLSTGTSVVAYYGLRRFRSFQINPAEFASNVVRKMHEAVVVTKSDFTIDFVNQEAERLLGGTAADLLGRSLKDRFDDTSWQAVTTGRAVDRASHARESIDRLHVLTLMQKPIPVRVYASTVELGIPTKTYIFIITDISDITESYHKLEESAGRITIQNKQLQDNQVTMERLLGEAQSLQKQLQYEKANIERTVDVRTAELREARDKLEASDQLKSEFIMLSSHNLRTPLTIMSASVELLTANQDTLTPEQKKTIELLSGSIGRMGEFVEDLLTIATLEAGDELSLVPTEIGTIIQPLIGETTSMAHAKKLTFKANVTDADIMVPAHALRLRGAIRNLLHNAVNFTESGEIGLTVSADQDSVQIHVTDTGIGIKPEELPNMFQKFHRGTSPLVYDYQGEGIGLYLSKLVIEEHGGHITVNSRLGEGSTFTVTLPRSPGKTTAVTDDAG